MAILNPEHLFEHAEKLILPPEAGPPRQVDVRRAISAAYYAVFHATAAAAADQFIGVSKRSTQPYGLVYRRIDHKWLKELCKECKKPSPLLRFSRFVPSGGFGPDLVAFATGAVELQEKRHSADYDPLIRVKTSDALGAIGTARNSVERLYRADEAARQTFLTLLMFPPRP